MSARNYSEQLRNYSRNYSETTVPTSKTTQFLQKFQNCRFVTLGPLTKRNTIGRRFWDPSAQKPLATVRLRRSKERLRAQFVTFLKKHYCRDTFGSPKITLYYPDYEYKRLKKGPWYKLTPAPLFGALMFIIWVVQCHFRCPKTRPTHCRRTDIRTEPESSNPRLHRAPSRALRLLRNLHY